MPLWLERLVIRNAGVEFVPLLVCIGGVVAVWLWQWWRCRRVRGEAARVASGVVRVGWGPGIAIVAVVVVLLAAFFVVSGMDAQALPLIDAEPWLVAWWVVGVGVAIGVWGVAVHAWRAEARLARQCRRCRYDMTGVPGLMMCPECGQIARSERKLRPTNIRRWALWLGCGVVACGLLLPMGIAMRQRGWAAGVPSSVLLWWVTEVTDPPEGVFKELLVRLERPEEQPWWQEQLRDRSETLAQRLLESSSPAIDQYAVLLRGIESDAARQAGMQAIRSVDPRHRRAGAALLVSVGSTWIELNLLETLLADTDPMTVQSGRWLLTRQASEFVNRLDGVGRPAESNPQEARRLLRLLCEMDGGLYIPGREVLSRWRKSDDPETRARAALLIFRWQHACGGRDTGLLREAFIAQRTLADLKLTFAGSDPQIMNWLVSPGEVESLASLIDDADASVREGMLMAMEALAKLWRPYTRPGEPLVLLVGFKGALASRLRVEKDPEVRARLGELIREAEGKPPAELDVRNSP